MAAPATAKEFLDLVLKSALVENAEVLTYLHNARAHEVSASPKALCDDMLRSGLLTDFQARQLMLGKWKGFFIGNYRVLEQLGSGTTSNVFLCVHKSMPRPVALKILAKTTAESENSLKRFYREARAGAGLNHPNIVQAYDIDEDKDLHFLVMDYVDGTNLEKIIKAKGPMDVNRACHYIRQAAEGLKYAHDAGLIHRDIKPSNLILNREGIVKILDMGVARLVNNQEEENLTKGLILGSADFLAPEQAEDSHSVDARADIYGLGATFYYLLTGTAPVEGKSVAQKLMNLHTKPPRPVEEFRTDVPSGVIEVIAKMMAKQAEERYASSAEVIEALAWWTRKPVPSPPEDEMPKLSLAALTSTAAKGDASPSPEPAEHEPAAPPRSNGVKGGKSTHAASSEPTAKHPPRKAAAKPISEESAEESDNDQIDETPRGGWLLVAGIGLGIAIGAGVFALILAQVHR